MEPPVEHHAGIPVLCPAYQRVREIETLLRDPKLHESLRHTTLKEIQRTPTGFLLTSEEGFQVEVLIHYYNIANYGPIGFTLGFPE